MKFQFHISLLSRFTQYPSSNTQKFIVFNNHKKKSMESEFKTGRMLQKSSTKGRGRKETTTDLD